MTKTSFKTTGAPNNEDLAKEFNKQGLVQDYSQRIEGAPLIETKPNLNLTKAISL